MNIYDMLRIRSTTPQTAAAAVLGVQAPGAPRVQFPDTSVLFNRAGSARSSFNAGDASMSYVLGQAGSGLGRIGAFGDSAFPVFGPYSFTKSCGYHYFVDSSPFIPPPGVAIGHGGGGSIANSFVTALAHAADTQTLVQFSPIQVQLFGRDPTISGLAPLASKGYDYLQAEIQNGNAVAKAQFDTLDAAMKQHIDAVESVLDVYTWGSNCDEPVSRPSGETLRAYQELLGLKNTMQAFANAPQTIPPVTEVGKQVDASNLNLDAATRSRLTAAIAEARAASARGNLSPWAQAQADAQQKMLDQQNAQPGPQQDQGAATATSALPSWALPIGVGLVAVTAAYFLLKKKKH